MDVNGGYTRVGVVTYSSAVAQSFNLNQYSSTDSLQRAISSLAFQGGSTITSAALLYVIGKILVRDAGDRSSVPNVVVVLTDGRSNNPSATAVSIAVLSEGLKTRAGKPIGFFWGGEF